MQNTIAQIVKRRSTEHKSGSKITLLWMKPKSKEPNVTFTTLIVIVLAVLIIAFAFIGKGIFFKELIASGLIILMTGILKCLDHSKQRFRTDDHRNNLN